MHTIKVNLQDRSYNIIIGNNIIGVLGSYIRRLDIGSDAYVITNAAIESRYGKILRKSLKEAGFDIRFKLVPDTEKSKSLNVACSVLKDLAGFDIKKRVVVIAFGGGVIGDLAGFVASIYKRGIPYLQVPTTLLAQVDSSIGGKTAVDLNAGKNLVGSFYQPRLVFADVCVLKSLGERQIKAGLAEVIKYGIIKDPSLFAYLERNAESILSLKTSSLEFIVARCAGIKAGITRLDEREKKGIRTMLNFGHTIGHAIEAASGYRHYNHGEAVALGMLIAADISRELGFIDSKIFERIFNLTQVMGLPVKIRRISMKDIISAHYRDKKFMGAINRFVLIKGIGKSFVTQDLSINVIRDCLKRRLA